MTDWTARRIVKNLADADRRRAILDAFWRFDDAESKRAAEAYLAKKLNFRDASFRRLPAERKAELLGARLGDAETEHYAGVALMAYHLEHARDLMAAFLDLCGIPNDEGVVGDDVAAAPDEAKVRAAATALAERFPRADLRLYLASAGLLMGDDWQAAMWPVVDELA